MEKTTFASSKQTNKKKHLLTLGLGINTNFTIGFDFDSEACDLISI